MATDHKRQAVPLAIAIVTLTLAGTLIYRQLANRSDSDGEPPNVYYVDLSSGAMIVVGADSLSPITTASGGTAVQAEVYACGSCASAEDRRIAYVQKYSAQAVQLLSQGSDDLNSQQLSIVDRGTFIAAWEDNGPGPWLPIDSPQSAAIAGAWREACANGAPKRCAP